MYTLYSSVNMRTINSNLPYPIKHKHHVNETWYIDYWQGVSLVWNVYTCITFWYCIYLISSLCSHFLYHFIHSFYFLQLLNFLP